jgi:N-acetylglucosamine kinase-like BadF-type ATPase
MERNLLLGVDAGTSKTHAMITDCSGNVLGFGESGCGNYEVAGLDGMIASINKAIQHALQISGSNKSNLLAMGFGVAGYDWPSERESMIKAIEALEIPANYDLVNDVEIGLIAGTKHGWGIAVDAGSGNNIRGRNKDGAIGRITGSSFPFGELGGAGEIVWQAVIAVTYAWTKRGPETRLTDLLKSHLGVESENNLIEGLATRKLLPSPSIAEDIFHLAIAGDSVAMEIIIHSAQELGKNVNAVIKQLNLEKDEFDIVTMGSVFKAGEIFTKPFRESILKFAPKANIFPLQVFPVVGAILLAADRASILTDDFREKIMRFKIDTILY